MSVGMLLKILLATMLAAVSIATLASVASADDPKDKEAREIAAMLTCRTCQGQSVAESSDQLAQSMRDVIRKKLDQGESREQILKYFVDRYGESILYEPPKTLWALLALAFVGAVGLSAFTLRRWKTRRQTTASSGPPEEPEDRAVYEARLASDSLRQSSAGSQSTWEQELKEIDDMDKIVNPGRSSTADGSGQRPKPSAPKRKDSKTKQPASAKPEVWKGTKRAKLRANGEASHGRGRLLAMGLMAILALLVIFASWSYLDKSATQAGAPAAPEAQAAKPIATLRTQDVHALAISPRDANLIYFGHHEGVMRGDDGGYHWSSLPVKGDAMGLAIPPAPDVIYMAGHEIFLRSNDGGKTWKAVANDLPDEDIHGFAVDTKDPRHLYAFVVGHGLFQSEDGGVTWKKSGNGLPNSVMALAVAADNPQILYAGSMDQGLLKSADGGATWKPADNGLGTMRVLSLATSPSAPGVVDAGTDRGLFESTDGGASWLPTGFKSAAAAVAVAPSDPKRILVVDDKTNVFRSEDAGASWGRAC